MSNTLHQAVYLFGVAVAVLFIAAGVIGAL